MVRTGGEGPKGISAVLVEAEAKGLSFGALEDKMGWRAQPTAQVQFDDCEIPAENLIGEAGRGFAYAMAGLDGGRLNIAAGALGGAQRAMDLTMGYVSERKAFGQSLDQFQACNSVWQSKRCGCNRHGSSCGKRRGSSTLPRRMPRNSARWQSSM